MTRKSSNRNTNRRYVASPLFKLTKKEHDAINSISQDPTAHHSSTRNPHPCHKWPNPPIAEWSIDYGYCRTSLDLQPDSYKIGSSDPQCPMDCPHKAPKEVVITFSKDFLSKGAVEAARISKGAKLRNDKSKALLADTTTSLKLLKHKVTK